jgi:hypothetical protein
MHKRTNKWPTDVKKRGLFLRCFRGGGKGGYSSSSELNMVWVRFGRLFLPRQFFAQRQSQQTFRVTFRLIDRHMQKQQQNASNSNPNPPSKAAEIHGPHCGLKIVSQHNMQSIREHGSVPAHSSEYSLEEFCSCQTEPKHEKPVTRVSIGNGRKKAPLGSDLVAQALSQHTSIL